MAEEELKAQIRKRGSLKHRLTNFINFINQCTSSDSPFESISEIKLRFDKFKTLYDEFQFVQEKVENLADEANLQEHYQYRDEFEDSFYAYTDKVTTILQSFEKQAASSAQHTIQGQNIQGVSNDNQTRSVISSSQSFVTQAPFSQNLPNQESHSLYPANSLRLPTVDLPKFSGDYHTWLEFKDTFESLVHNNENIPAVLKFHYLRSSLIGHASQHIQSVEFSAANYDNAWEGLLERYDNHRLLKHNHVKAIFDLGNLKKETHGQIRHLLDSLSKHLQSLRALGEPVEHWDTVIIYIICNKLDETTAREWEHAKGNMDNVTLEDLYAFLKIKADELEALSMRDSKSKQNLNQSKRSNVFASHDKHRKQCFHCKGGHMIYTCTEFLKLDIPSRTARVRELKLCDNCLGNHKAENCQRGPCRVCKARHNSLLHTEVTQPSKQVTGHSTHGSHILLATAQVSVVTPKGRNIIARVLLDSGSQSNFCTTNLWKASGVPQVPTKMSVIGISNAETEVTTRCTLKIKSNCSSFSRNVSCYILDSITDRLPTSSIDLDDWNLPDNVTLSDPSFFEPGDIDILLGAGVFWEVLCNGKISLRDSHVILQNTSLGWIVSGTLPSVGEKTRCNFSTINLDVQQQLERFWELEEMPKHRVFTPEEQQCENHFQQTFTRHEDGKFMVRMPLKTSPETLGDSRQAALKRLQSLERRFKSDAQLHQLYVAFMDEYEALGHMTPVHPDHIPVNSYFLPHHGVLKRSIEGSKLRVVFDGSAKSSTDISVNDLQLIGPTIQDGLLAIFLRFRLHRYVIGSDIRMMYRQIWMHRDDRKLQLILWRSDASQDIKTFMLNTVTYGMASSPYLAIRCLNQLALDGMNDCPSAAQTILSDFYVDDLLTGGQDIQELIQRATDIEAILQAANFPLHKWVSNSPEIMKQFSSPNMTSHRELINFGDHNNNKTLGLYWSPEDDFLQYSVKESNTRSSRTKRNLLSDISQIWDPLGLIAPCVISAKIILQKLWSYKLDWDDEVPDDLHSEYDRFRSQLVQLNYISIHRRVTTQDPTNIQLCGFADASQEAYGACIYIRSIDRDGSVTTGLLCARSRVAPLKTQTIPRLELCAALLLAELADNVATSINIELDSIFLWSDSTIVLHWLHTSPNKLQVFVANRVVRILSLSKVQHWHHIPGECNPADVLSRGTSADLLAHNHLWWHGPDWLGKPLPEWPQSSPTLGGEVPELRKATVSLVMSANEGGLILFERYSSLTRLKRVLAHCFRFIKNCRMQRAQRVLGCLRTQELSFSMTSLILLSQSQSFSAEIGLLRTNQFGLLRGPLRRLNPFIDNKGILRVGGRLGDSSFSFNKKHPILLSSGHPLAKLIFSYAHLELLHAPPQLLLYHVRETYWPLGGRALARSTVHKCVKCCKVRPIPFAPQMGNLPVNRVKPNYPFAIVGTDFAGPFTIRDRKGRRCQHLKCYVCIFICFSSKAVHLEAVTDLSTECFMACFKRFCSRRGKPSQVYSDNGTNFVGAKNELYKLYESLRANSQDISNGLAEQNITWSMIPPQSPHFGGLWEAGVKTVKYHLKRVMGNALLTYESFNTLLTEIEAVINSRPLSPLSVDPNDLEALSPSHFLIGRRLVSSLDPDYTRVRQNRLSDFQHCQALQQHFWQRWAKEYISELQVRQKWQHRKDNPKSGTLVVIKENNLPVLQWHLGRIVELFPGPDGIARVASIKTSKGIVKRALTKLCPLPMEDNNQ